MPESMTRSASVWTAAAAPASKKTSGGRAASMLRATRIGTSTAAGSGPSQRMTKNSANVIEGEKVSRKEHVGDREGTEGDTETTVTATTASMSADNLTVNSGTHTDRLAAAAVAASDSAQTETKIASKTQARSSEAPSKGVPADPHESVSGGGARALLDFEQTKLSLWGVAAKNEVVMSAPAASAVNVSAGSAAAHAPTEKQGTGEPTREASVPTSRFDMPIPPPPPTGDAQFGPRAPSKTSNPITNLFQKVIPRQQYNRTDSSDDANGTSDDVEAAHPELAGAYGTTGQNHDYYFTSEATRTHWANACSYLSDAWSLLGVLLLAPFQFLRFLFSGRDYYDRYGGTPTAAEGAFAESTQSSDRLSREEMQERSEVYLEAKEEDGTLFALLAFHHPGLTPLVDETVDAAYLTQVLGEDTVKTGDDDLNAALDPDRCIHLPGEDSGEDESQTRSVDGTRSIGSMDANRSGRSSTTGRSRQRSVSRQRRSRSRSVDARAHRRGSRSDDEWVFDIKKQKMRKKKGRRRRDKRHGSRGFDSQSLDGMSLGFDEALSVHSGDILSGTTASASNEPPMVIAASSATGLRRGRSRTSRSCSVSEDEGEVGGERRGKRRSKLKNETSEKWNERGRTSQGDRAAWKRNQMSFDGADDLVAAAVADLEALGNDPSPYVAEDRLDEGKGIPDIV